MSGKILKELMKLGFRHVGDFFPKGKRVQFSLTSHKNNRGSYAFVIDQKIKYVGITKSTLYARMNGYRNPGTSQETNKRIHSKITNAGKVQIYFLPESEITKFNTIIRRDGIEQNIPTDMDTFERFVIAMFGPEWNQR